MDDDALAWSLERIAGELRGDNARELIGLLREAATRLRAVATVTDEDVERITDVFLAHTGQAHKVTQLQRDLARPCMRAALESFANKEPTDE